MTETDIRLTDVLSFLGMENASQQEKDKIQSEVFSLSGRFSPRYVFKRFQLCKTDGCTAVEGTDILLTDPFSLNMLGECSSVVILLCTLGLEFDLYTAREASRDMALCLTADAFGNAAAEAGCDAAEEEIRALFRPLYTTDRFSPGYSGIPLSLQKQINEALCGEKRLGIYTNDSFMFTPLKTVSAFIGLSENKQPAKIRGCSFCALHDDCTLRKDGGFCARNN